MKKSKLLCSVLPISIIGGSIPALVTSCGCHTDTVSDFVSFDKVQTEMYGTYDELLGYTSVVDFDGFVLNDGFSVEDLEVKIENCDFVGTASAAITKTGDKTFKVKMIFEADEYLYGKTTKFDLYFSHKSSQGHIQKLTGCSVEFVYYDLWIRKQDFSYEQTVVTTHDKISYITEGIFSAYNTYGEAINDLSNFTVEAKSDPETTKVSAQIVPLYQNYFAIQLNIDNVTNSDVTITYTIKNKKLPTWSQDLHFKLTMSNKAEDAFLFGDTASGVALLRCYLQDASVSIPETYNDKDVTAISTSAFEYCYNLRNLHISKNIHTIGQNVFNGTYINAITVDESNTEFTSKANGQECNCIMKKPSSNDEPVELVIGCGKTKIPGTVSYIHAYAFKGCYSLEELDLPDSVTILNSSTFENCINLKKANLNKVQNITDGAFLNCSSLNELNLGTQLTTISEEVFSGCESLTSLNIPATVQSIDSKAFYKCPYLEDISVAEDNQNYTSTADGKAINGIVEIASKTLILGGNKITIPTNISKIGDYAFAYRLGMPSSLTIPANVNEIGQNAFQNCYDLASIELLGVETIGNEAFCSCSNLETVNLGTKLVSIGNNAFYHAESLRTIDIPATCITINHGAFYGCNLRTVTLHEGLKTIGEMAFASCTSLSQINFPNTIESIGDGAFNACGHLIKADLSNTKITELISTFGACTNLQEVKLPDTCTKIGKETFHSCESLVTFSAKNITSIGDEAFFACKSMDAIDLSKVTTLGKQCFAECLALQEANLSSLTGSIPEKAFMTCDSLKTVTLSNNAITISNHAFDGCDVLESINLDHVTSIGDYAFVNCPALKDITLSEQLTSIGVQAFAAAEALTSIVIPASVTSIGTYAFFLSGIKTAEFKDINNWKDKDGNTITLEAGASEANAKLLYSCVEWKKGA